MKKFLPILFSILFFLYSAPAQKEIKSDNWLLFDPLQEEFSIEFPPNVINKSFVDDKGNLISGFYKAHFNNTYFFVRSEGEKNIRSFDSLRNYILANQASNSAEVINGFNADVYKFSDVDGFYNRILVIRTNRRTYYFHTLSEAENNPDVARFFDSIAFVEKINKSKPTRDDKNPTLEQKETFKLPPRGSGTGNGIGSGRGSGVGSSDANAPKTEPVTENSPLRILSKPFTGYTELAREYQITGVIRLRVTFLENGQIGDVTSVTKLPFGLTRNSVEAARQIRFSPQIQNGKPVSVTKIVEYNFMIY